MRNREARLTLLGGVLLAVLGLLVVSSGAAPRPLSAHAPIVVHHGGWKCTGPQDRTVVIVQDPVDKNGEPLSAAVNITDGCTGTIGAIVVLGNQRDGIKVGGTAHDVEVLSGWIACGPRAGDVHQDGVQAGGGTHVHFHALHVDCPESNNSAFFVNQTNGGSGVRPTDITCAGCDLLAANNAFNVGEDSTQLGRPQQHPAQGHRRVRADRLLPRPGNRPGDRRQCLHRPEPQDRHRTAGHAVTSGLVPRLACQLNRPPPFRVTAGRNQSRRFLVWSRVAPEGRGDRTCRRLAGPPDGEGSRRSVGWRCSSPGVPAWPRSKRPGRRIRRGCCAARGAPIASRRAGARTARNGSRPC